MARLTNEQLSALPERKDYIDTIITAEGDPRGRPGTTVRERVAPDFRTFSVKPDDVFLFSDSSGSWFVDYHSEGGPYKRRAYL